MHTHSLMYAYIHLYKLSLYTLAPSLSLILAHNKLGDSAQRKRLLLYAAIVIQVHDDSPSHLLTLVHFSILNMIYIYIISPIS